MLSSLSDISVRIDGNSTLARMIMSKKRLNVRNVFSEHTREQSSNNEIITNIISQMSTSDFNYKERTIKLRPIISQADTFNRKKITLSSHKLDDQKHLNLIAYELCLLSIISPLKFTSNTNKEKYLIELIKASFDINDEEERVITARVRALCSTNDSLLKIYIKQNENINNHLFYNENSFNNNKKAYEKWKQDETNRIQKIMNSFDTPKRKNSSSQIVVSKLIAEIIKIEDNSVLTKKSGLSVSVSFSSQTKNTSPKSNDDLVWNEFLIFDVYNTTSSSDKIKIKFNTGHKNSILANSKSFKSTLTFEDIQSSQNQIMKIQLQSKTQINIYAKFTIIPLDYYVNLNLPCSYHNLYEHINMKIAENFWNKISKDENCEKPFSLTQDAIDLIDDFAYRFGIYSNYKNLTTLRVLLYYSNTLRDLKTIYNLLVSFSYGDFLSSLTKEELARVEELKSISFDLVSQLLELGSILFHNDRPRGSFSMAIKILKHLKQDDYLVILRECYIRSIKYYYPEDQRKLLRNGTLNAKELLHIFDYIISHVDEYINCLDKLHPDELKPSKDIVNQYVQTFGKDLTSFFNCSNDDDKKNVYSIFQRTLYLFKNWKIYCNDIDSKIPVYDYFEKHLSSWIDNIFSNMINWTLKVAEMDEFLPLGDEILHSSSVVDLFSFANQALENLKSILKMYDNPKVYNFLSKFSDWVGRVAVMYCGELESKFNEEILKYKVSDVEKETFSFLLFLKANKSKGKERFKATEKLCVILNNIETCRKLLHELCTEIYNIYESLETPLFNDKPKDDEDDYISTLFGKQFADIKGILMSLIHCTSEGLHSFIEEELYHILRIKKERSGKIVNEVKSVFSRETLSSESLITQLSAFFDHMNEQLQLFVNTLYISPFKMLIKSIWNKIINILYVIIVPAQDRNTLTESQVELLLNLQIALRDYFTAGGEGIPLHVINNEMCTQQIVSRCICKSTEDIIEIIDFAINQQKNLIAKGKPKDVHNATLISYLKKMLRLRAKSRKDKLAKKYLKKLDDKML